MQEKASHKIQADEPANTFGVDDQSTQPSSIVRNAGKDLPVEFGRYRLLKQLGEGGMGAVYLAHDSELDRKVALKLPHFNGKRSKDLSERFRREARLAATLDHTNICRVFDIGEHQGRLFLTMALVEGKSLHEIIKAKGAIDPRTAVTLLKRIASAVQFAHDRGIIHRDLKPANIMIKKDRDFVIMDFGLARRLEQEEEQLTAAGAVLGTPAYMAPELLRGENEAVGPQSDVYSLGIILYELLTGQRPFQGTLPQIYAQVLTAVSITPSSIRSTIDTSLDAIYQKATHADVSKRFKSSDEFATALGNYLVQPTQIPDPLVRAAQVEDVFRIKPQVRSSLPPRRRNPTMLVAGGAAFFAILLGVIVILIRNKDGTTTELRVPDGAVAVEVKKDNRTIATLDVAADSNTAATERAELPVDQSQKTPRVLVGALSESAAIHLLHSNWSLSFEQADGTRSIVKPLEKILDNGGKLVSIRADTKQDFPANYVKNIFVPCIGALPKLRSIEGIGQFTYSEQEFLELGRTPFATNGTILSGSRVPLTEAVAESLRRDFLKVEFISLLLDKAKEREIRSIASLKRLRSVWFNGIGDSVGPMDVEAIAGMNLDFFGLYLSRKFTNAELVSLSTANARDIELNSCDFDDSDLAILAKRSRLSF